MTISSIDTFYKEVEKGFRKYLDKIQPGPPPKRSCRSKEVIKRDFGFPRQSYLQETTYDERAEGQFFREMAIIKVLRRLPKYAYDFFVAHKQSIYWYRPGDYLGCTLTIEFPLRYDTSKDKGYFNGEFWNEIKGYVALIHLPSRLEEEECPFIMNVVAHELAHVFLMGNWMQGVSPALNEKEHNLREKLTDLLVDKWGMGREFLEKNSRSFRRGKNRLAST